LKCCVCLDLILGMYLYPLIYVNIYIYIYDICILMYVIYKEFLGSFTAYMYIFIY